VFGFLRSRPYLQVFIAFAAGVALAPHAPAWTGGVAAIAPIAAALIALLILAHRRAPHLAAPVGLALVAVAGFVNFAVTKHVIASQPILTFGGTKSHEIVGRIASYPKVTDEQTSFLLDVTDIDGVKRGWGRTMVFYLHAPEQEAKPANGGAPRDATSPAPRPPPTPQLPPPPTVSFALFRGDTVKATGTIHRAEARLNTGDFAYDELLLDRGTQAIAVISAAERLSRLNPSRSFFDALVASLQGALFGQIHENLAKPLDDLLISVIYGDKVVQLSDDVQNAFRRAGMMHILVVSGTQVSFLIIFLSLFFIRVTFDLSRRGVVLKVVQFATIVLVVFIFALITGFEISIIRAFLMGVLILFARVVNRDADGMNCLAQAGLIMLIVRPADLFTASFDLSFAATFGLIYTFGCVYPLIPKLRAVPHYAVATLISTGGAQIFLTPFLVQTFNQFTMWGLPSNLVAIPVSFWILAIGTVFNVVSFSGVAFIIAPLAFILTWLLKFLLWWATLFASLPGSNMPVATMPTLAVAGYFAAVFILGETLRIWRGIDIPKRYALVSATTAVVLALVVYAFAREANQATSVRVLALSAGQAVVVVKSGSTSVVLTPPSFPLRLKRYARSIDSNLRSLGVRRIDRLYFTDDWHRDEVAVALAVNYRLGVISDATGEYALKASPGGDPQTCPIESGVPDARVPIEAVKALHWGGYGITSYIVMLGDARVLVLEDFRDKFFPDERIRLPNADYYVTSARNLRLITLPPERVIEAARDATVIVDGGRLPELPDSAASARKSSKLISTNDAGEVVLRGGKGGGVRVRTYLRKRPESH